MTSAAILTVQKQTFSDPHVGADALGTLPMRFSALIKLNKTMRDEVEKLSDYQFVAIAPIDGMQVETVSVVDGFVKDRLNLSAIINASSPEKMAVELKNYKMKNPEKKK